LSTQTNFISVEWEQEIDSTFTLGPVQRVNTFSTGNAADPEIVLLDNGGHVIVWVSYDQETSVRSTYSVHAQIYGPDGAPRGPEIQVNTKEASTQHQPSVVGMPDGGFAVAFSGWDQSTTDSRYDIVLSQFDADGQRLGSDTVVHGVDTFDQSRPALSVQENGTLAVSYYANSANIVFQTIAANGTASAASNVLDANNSASDQTSDLIALSDGTFGVVTTRNGALILQKFDASGGKLGSNVNLESAEGFATSAQAVVLESGAILIGWNNNNAPGAHFAIYDEGGGVILPTQVINQTQYGQPQLVALESGGFAIGYVQGSNVFVQEYSSAFEPVDTPVQLGGAAGSRYWLTLAPVEGGGLRAVFYDNSLGYFVTQDFSTTPQDSGPELDELTARVNIGAFNVTSEPFVFDNGVQFYSDTALAGGELRVYFSSRGEDTDTLSVQSLGPVLVDDSAVSVGDVEIGSIDAALDGTAGQALSIALNAAATPETVRAVIEALAYQSSLTATQQSGKDKYLGLYVADSTGAQSEVAQLWLNIGSGVTGFSGLKLEDWRPQDTVFSVEEMQNGAVLLDAFVDFDHYSDAGFDGGSVSIELVSSTSYGRGYAFSLRDEGSAFGQVGFDGNSVTYGGVVVGTLDDVNIGNIDSRFQINLNADATRDAVRAIVENLTIEVPGLVNSVPYFAPRLTIVDGDGAQVRQDAYWTYRDSALTTLDQIDQPAAEGEQQVNTFTLNAQSGAEVAALADGGYLVTWSSQYQDVTNSADYGIFGQRYDANGARIGGEVQVNSISGEHES